MLDSSGLPFVGVHRVVDGLSTERLALPAEGCRWISKKQAADWRPHLQALKIRSLEARNEELRHEAERLKAYSGEVSDREWFP